MKIVSHNPPNMIHLRIELKPRTTTNKDLRLKMEEMSLQIINCQQHNNHSEKKIILKLSKYNYKFILKQMITRQSVFVEYIPEV